MESNHEGYLENLFEFPVHRFKFGTKTRSNLNVFCERFFVRQNRLDDSATYRVNTTQSSKLRVIS